MSKASKFSSELPETDRGTQNTLSWRPDLDVLSFKNRDFTRMFQNTKINVVKITPQLRYYFSLRQYSC